MLQVNQKEISKDKLRAEFSKNPEKYYSTETFKEKGFKRQKCSICGKWFWAIAETNNCGDSSHTPYSFFKEKPERISYTDFWKKFSGFFRRNGHAIIKRYPVVSRWRQDLYFTIAGIQDFQRIENGLMSFEYSANPLLVPQPCLRFKDIENVGVTGNHFTTFVMANQTSFNYPREGYWRDRTIELNFNFLTKVLGIEPEEIKYSEDVWAMPDFSEFGPSLEFFSKGAELGNNVFTQFELAEGRIRELEGKVVDTGWGFERELWFYTGLNTAYDAVFGQVLDKVQNELNMELDTEFYSKFAKYGGALNRDEVKNVADAEKRVLQMAKIAPRDYERKIKPMQAIYALLDHTRTLLFAITDGSLPSNVGGGYNLRVLLRRSFDFIEEYGLRIDIRTLAELIAADLKPMYPELSTKHDIIEKVVNVERDRYEHAKESAKKAVEVLLEKGKSISKEQMRTLYESHGATPELIAKVAADRKVKLDLPDGSYTAIVQEDMVKRRREDESRRISLPKNLPPTKKLYYDFATRSRSKVLFAKDNYFVLDKTPFYPEGGGQVADAGTVDGKEIKDVQKVGDIIVHFTEKNSGLKKGEIVDAIVDEERRNAVIAHHTATHLISAAARRVLGDHAWQEGARKEAHKAHIDIAHYEKLSEENVKAIETMVNAWLFNGIKVHAEEMSRGEAEGRYGFSIYQGHGAPAKRMRIVTIRDREGKLIDAEACGGLHAVGRENLLGIVCIIDTARIHDGIDRIEFVAGPAALKRFEVMHKELDDLARAFNVDPLLVGKKIKEQQEELRSLHKQVEKNNELLADSIAESIQDAEVIERELDVDRKMLVKIADLLVKRNNESIVLLRNKYGYVICMAGSASGKSAAEFLDSRLKGQRFSGGGSRRFAEAKIEQKQAQ
jgi:alanyl-tRNA synthetase